MDLIEKIKSLTRQILPSGRAFRLFGWGDLLIEAIAEVEANAYSDSVSLLDSLMPDTDRFSADDCTTWERILGVATNANNTLQDRRSAIRRKMSNPGVNPAKGHLLYMQQQLQEADFPVYVFANKFDAYPDGYTTMNPATVSASLISSSQHGDRQHGQGVQSSYINQVAANSIENSVDVYFNPGANLNSTFFIGGMPLGTYANVPASREVEFRQTILQLKQTHRIGFLLINYT